jgi:uncharacterized protein (DUF58 family)
MTADAPPDVTLVERAARGLALLMPRTPHRGRLGDVRATSVGSSLELHDFRQYQPGDDLRHIDWNAVARTGELILRVRQDEVSPRVEVVLDTTASMSVSRDKSARGKEIALWVCELARHAGCEPVLFLAGGRGQRVTGATKAVLLGCKAEGTEAFDLAVTRLPPLLECGLRVVVSDFLVQAPPAVFAERLARHAAGCVLVQVLDIEDVDPSPGPGAKLLDVESQEVLERLLSEDVVAAYRERFAALMKAWQAAAQRVQARWIQVVATASIERLARDALAPLVTPA